MTLPTKAELDAIDMWPIIKQFNQVPEVQYLAEPAGLNHYRLLVWLSRKAGYVSDIGTYMGLSAACLAYGGTFVNTYDTTFMHVHMKPYYRSFVTFILAKDTESFSPEILQSDLILVDTWHEGKMERDVYDFLVVNKWKGVLIYDDIYYNDAMRAFWESLPEPKIDATKIGHITGTGIIEFI